MGPNTHERTAQRVTLNAHAYLKRRSEFDKFNCMRAWLDAPQIYICERGLIDLSLYVHTLTPLSEAKLPIRQAACVLSVCVFTIELRLRHYADADG